MSATGRPCPEWFAQKKYGYPLDLGGWIKELERVNGFSWSGREEWRAVILDIDDYFPSYIPPPPVEAIDRAEASRELLALEQPALLVRIHLAAPDAIIIKGFRAALAEARKDVPSPVKNRGRYRLNGQFSPSKFATWRRYRIIELAELLDWREKQWPENAAAEGERPSDAQLGAWLKFANPAADVGIAKKTLSGALGAIRALSAQANARSK